MKQFLALVTIDLKLFFNDRRAITFTVGMPIIIASFFGAMMGGRSGEMKTSGVLMRVVDQDQSLISRSVITNLLTDSNLRASPATEAEARELVKTGKVPVAVILPPGFGEAAGRSLFGGGKKPEVTILRDPSRNSEAAMVRGILMQHVMQAVSREMFGGQFGREMIRESIGKIPLTTNLPPEDREVLSNLLAGVEKWMDRPISRNTNSTSDRGSDGGGLTLPFETRDEVITNERKTEYNGYAHSFAGMGVQFVLMASIEFGAGILLDRQRGLWRRLRAAPVSRRSMLLAKLVSMAVIASFTLIVAFSFAVAVFGVRIEGSLAGMLLSIAAIALLCGSLGLMLAAIGKTPHGTRTLSIPAVLILLMLGGAWVPTFVFPLWLQKLTLITPTRWAVDSLNAMTWRGLGIGTAVTASCVMLGYALFFGVIAWWRFKWEED